MKYPLEDSGDKPGKPKVWVVTCKSLSKTKTGWRITWEKTEKDGWEEHIEID